MYNAQLMVFRKDKLIKRVEKLFMFNLNKLRRGEKDKRRQEKARVITNTKQRKIIVPNVFVPKLRIYLGITRQRMLRKIASHSLLFPR